MLNFLLRAGVSILIFVLLFNKIPFHDLKPYIYKVNINWFSLALVLQLLSSVLAAIRWSLIMDSLKFVAPKYFYLKSYLIAVMFNQVLPTSIGGDAYKVLVVSKLNHGKKLSALSVLIDRFYGMAGLIIINLFSLPMAYQIFPQHLFALILLVNFGFFLGLSFLITVSLLKIYFKHFTLKLISDLAHQLAASAGSWQSFIIKSILAVLPNLLTIYTFVLIAYSLGIDAKFMDFITILPSLLLLILLPISLGGWGVREGIMVFLGSLIGLSKAEALSISLLFGFNTLLTSIPGLYLYSLHPKRKGTKV